MTISDIIVTCIALIIIVYLQYDIIKMIEEISQNKNISNQFTNIEYNRQQKDKVDILVNDKKEQMSFDGHFDALKYMKYVTDSRPRCICLPDKCGGEFSNDEIDGYRNSQIDFHSKINGTSKAGYDAVDKINMYDEKCVLGEKIGDVYDKLVNVTPEYLSNLPGELKNAKNVENPMNGGIQYSDMSNIMTFASDGYDSEQMSL